MTKHYFNFYDIYQTIENNPDKFDSLDLVVFSYKEKAFTFERDKYHGGLGGLEIDEFLACEEPLDFFMEVYAKDHYGY